MKQIVIMLVVLSLLILSACSSQEIQGEVTGVPTKASPAQEEVPTSGCPRGIHDDPAPGLCMLYTDKNNNDFCDYGE